MLGFGLGATTTFNVAITMPVLYTVYLERFCWVVNGDTPTNIQESLMLGTPATFIVNAPMGCMAFMGILIPSRNH